MSAPTALRPLEEMIERWQKKADELENEPEFDGGISFGMNDCINELSSVLPEIKRLIGEIVAAARSETLASKSDGYHTFAELYEHRHALFLVICRTFGGWKSKLHSDGTMFEGWFIAGCMTPKGQITYHLPLEWWDRFKCIEVENAPKWDGHTPNDVNERVQSLDLTHLSEIRELEIRIAEIDQMETIVDEAGVLAEFGSVAHLRYKNKRRAELAKQLKSLRGKGEG